MSEVENELMLLERVFLRLGSADTDEQLENLLSKFLTPVLDKLSSPDERVRKKVMELLIHVNKRVKTRPQIQLPMEDLLNQYKDPSATSFVINFTIIYLKLGFPRLPIEKQADLVPIVLNALENKPAAHLDSLLGMVIPILGTVKVPTDPEKVGTLFNLHEKPIIAKHLLEMLLDMLLLPYGSLQVQSLEVQVPPCLSAASFKRVIANPMKPEELEEIKLGIVKFLSHGVFKDEDVLSHLIVAAADTRFSVANLADMELKKVIGSVDWANPSVVQPLFTIFLGNEKSNIKEELRRSPASTRIRLKLLNYMCRITEKGFIFPASIQLIFDSLYGANTNTKLKTLALNFTMNLIRYSDKTILSKVAPVLLSGLQKLIKDGEEVHQGQAYILIGILAQHFPQVVYHDMSLLESYFQNLETANPDLKLQIREGMLTLITAYKYNVEGQQVDKDGRLNILLALIKVRIKSEEPMVRFVAVKTLATVFPPEHVPSKYLLLLAVGDSKDEVSAEALKALYGTARKNDIDLTRNNQPMPVFNEITGYIYQEAETIQKDATLSITINNHTLPFNLATYLEIVLYLRLCLLKTVEGVPLTRDVLCHPCDYSPSISKHLHGFYDAQKSVSSNPILQYVSLVRKLLLANPSVETLSCMIEITGCLTSIQTFLKPDTTFLRDNLLNSSKEEIRELGAVLHALATFNTDQNDFDNTLEMFMNRTKNKLLESQHGAILALGASVEYRIVNGLNVKEELLRNTVVILDELLKNPNALLVSGACTSLGCIGRVKSLPLDDSNEGSPQAKRSTVESITKLDIVDHLFTVMNNTKLSAKIRERSARTLGLLCVGEAFPHTKDIIQRFLATAKETKDIEVHFTIGEALVMCCQGRSSPEARNIWTDPAENEGGSRVEVNLEWLLDELVTLAKHTHPNAKQASCIWLLAVVKSCGEQEAIRNKLQTIQNTFMDLLCQNNEIVQDAASKGLCVMYDTYKSEELLAALVKQLTSGTRQVSQVTADTQLFEEGQLGKSPTGGNLTTYKELCSLASDLNKPDLIYQFMHLANHNAIWNSKKGAAFGFSSIAERCGQDLKAHLPIIIPKLYRYQFDPTPSIQASMQNIWRVLVSEPQKVLDEYYHEIMKDLLDNLNSGQYRVRQSCCLALQDFLKGSGNRSIHDAINYMDELWSKLFRVMDDHHEATRLTATRTAKVLSKLCIRGCDVSQGKAGVKMVEALLPPLLNNGITNPVADVRLISLQTISELVGAAGKQLKPFLPKLIPALLQATGELESTKLSYLSTMMGAQAQAQEAIDSARASFAKSHFTTETVSKSLQYADSTILEELIPKIVDLLKMSVGLGTRIASAHFVTLLVVQMGQELQPFTSKLLAALVNGLTDRNAAIRKHYASTIGHLVVTAKESSLDKLFAKLQHWYFEREDDSVRSACAFTIQSIGIHNQEILKDHSETILPLVFFAMHSEKTPETQATLDVWTEIWSEHSPGTETGIRQNLAKICEMLKNALESPSWTMKAQAANAVCTVASKLGSTMDSTHRQALIVILLSGLVGRTWKGKEKLLMALASISTNCKDALKNEPESNINSIIEAVLKESRKEEIVYQNSALKCLGDILSSLEIDRFDQVYTIIKPILIEDKTAGKTEGEGAATDENTSFEEISKKREDTIRLKETAYETLGKTWPKNGKDTQEKYREMFVQHCVTVLPNLTRSVQVSVVAALYNFVDKLILLNNDENPVKNNAEEKILSSLIDDVLVAVKYSLGIGKNTRLRKEALNVVHTLATKLKETKREGDFNKLKVMFEQVSDDIAKDSQPEIKSRMNDIKAILYNA